MKTIFINRKKVPVLHRTRNPLRELHPALREQFSPMNVNVQFSPRYVVLLEILAAGTGDGHVKLTKKSYLGLKFFTSEDPVIPEEVIQSVSPLEITDEDFLGFCSWYSQFYRTEFDLRLDSWVMFFNWILAEGSVENTNENRLKAVITLDNLLIWFRDNHGIDLRFKKKIKWQNIEYDETPVEAWIKNYEHQNPYRNVPAP